MNWYFLRLCAVLLPAAAELFVWQSGRRFDYRQPQMSVSDLQHIYNQLPGAAGRLVDSDGAQIVTPTELSHSQTVAALSLPGCEPIPQFHGEVFSPQSSAEFMGRCAVVRECILNWAELGR